MVSVFIQAYHLRLLIRTPNHCWKAVHGVNDAKMVKGLTAQGLFIGFRLMDTPDTNPSMQNLASLGQSCRLAHQQGRLFKVNEQNTLCSMCTLRTSHLMELGFYFSSPNLRQWQWCTVGTEQARQLQTRLPRCAMDFALLVVS